MKFFISLLFILGVHFSIGQSNNLALYKNYFNSELKLWTNSFINFELYDFIQSDTEHFDNILDQNFTSYKDFLSIYGPIITYSPDSSKFIDIYCYQLNLEKKGKWYYANPAIDQIIFLCDREREYWNRVYFATTSSNWIDDVIWLSKTKFILVGCTKSINNKNHPLVLIGDTKTQTLKEYLDKNSLCYQNKKGYISLKLKKIKIKGL